MALNVFKEQMDGGCYGTDTVDEQLAIQNLLGLSNDEFR